MSPVASALVAEGPHISNAISTVSVSENFSYPVANSALVIAKSSVPLESETESTSNALLPCVLSKVVPVLALPAFARVVSWSMTYTYFD